MKAARLWEDLEFFKTGLCYNELTFTPGKIRDYLKSFKGDDLRMPGLLVVDGLDFDKDQTHILDEFKQISLEYPIAVWFSMKTHREEALCADGYPPQLENLKDWFLKALNLQPQGNKIEAVVIKDGQRANTTFLLDPATMMIQDS
jgi:hypothetical protein